MIVWCVVCIIVFRCDYLHYKKAPQYYYLRRMLGLGVCISRGTAALVNIGIFLLVLPMGRSLLSLLRSFLPLWLNLLCDSFLPSSKTMHLVIAITILLTSVAHSISHIVNAFNFSRHYIPIFPEVNMASYKGESPLLLIFTSVPGLTGVSMLLILAALGITSLKCVRTRQFEVFYYTHYSCVLFLLILLIHPLSGVLKGVLNVDSHPPGCRYKKSASDLNDGNRFNSEFENKEMKHQQSKGLKESLPSNFLSESTTNNVSAKEGAYSIPSKFRYGHPQSYKKEEFKPPSPGGSIFLKESYPTLLKDGPEYSEVLDEVFGYPEPEPFEEVFGYPEPFEELEYPDSALNLPEAEAEVWFSDADSDSVSETLLSQQEPNDRLRGGTKRKNRKYCLKPPLFVTIESKSWLWVLATMLYLLVNCIIKWWRGQQEVEVLRVREFPANVLELTLRKKGFHCNPGQYILLRCPKASRYQWHPFTVAQCPSNQSECFIVLIRTKGNWCRKLRDQVYLSLLKTQQAASKIPLPIRGHEVGVFHPEPDQIFNYSLWTNCKLYAGNDFHGHPYQQKRISQRSNHAEFYCISSANEYKSEREAEADTRSRILSHLSSSGLPPGEVNANGMSRCHLTSVTDIISRGRSQPYHHFCLNKYLLSHLPNHSFCEKLPNTSINVKRSALSMSELKCFECASSYCSNDQTTLVLPPLSSPAFQSTQKLRCKTNDQREESKLPKAWCDNVNYKFNQRSYSLGDNWSQSHSAAFQTSCNDFPYHSPPKSHHSLSHHDLHYLNLSSNKLAQNLEDRPIKKSEFEGTKSGVSKCAATIDSSPRESFFSASDISGKQKRRSSYSWDRRRGSCPYVIDIERAQHMQSFRQKKLVNQPGGRDCLKLGLSWSNRKIWLFFDGPFNSPNEAVLSYPVVIGIVGGIGVTPLLASLNNLRNYWQPNPRRVHVIWILRELQLILPLAPFFQSLIEFFWARKQEDRLEFRIYCTGSVADDHDFFNLLQNHYPFLKARLHEGRPNWDDLFDVWKEAYRKCMVGVFCCGPKSLNREIRNYTLEALGQGLNFNYHHESFS